MTDLITVELFQELIDAVVNLADVLTYIFITLLVFFVRWETKGGTFKR